MNQLMTLQEVADYLRVTEKTIYRLLRRGKIPATKVGNQWRFDKTLVDEWLQRNSVGTKANILVIDDEETIRSLFKETLEELGHTVITAETGSEGLELVKQHDFALVFLDLTIITGYPDSGMMRRALAQGPFGVMNKPFGESDIITAVANFLHITQRER